MVRTSFYSQLQGVSGLIFVIYSLYFIIIAYASLSKGTFKDLKKSYQFSLVMTLVVIAGFLGLLLIQLRRNMRSDEDTLYISFISLVNVYMCTVAYLYSPAVDSLQDIQYKEARREHEHIMNQFYEQELPDISGRSESTSLSRSNNGVEKRRYMKRDKTEKAKEKLWESIIKETEDEASDDSSGDDDGERI